MPVTIDEVSAEIGRENPARGAEGGDRTPPAPSPAQERRQQREWLERWEQRQARVRAD